MRFPGKLKNVGRVSHGEEKKTNLLIDIRVGNCRNIHFSPEVMEVEEWEEEGEEEAEEEEASGRKMPPRRVKGENKSDKKLFVWRIYDLFN